MTEAQIQLQNALTTTFLANLAFLSEYDNELYHRVDELSRMIENGDYKEKYALDFILENGDFDIYDILNDKYLYNNKPKQRNDDLVKKVEFDEKQSIFELEAYFANKKKFDIDYEKRFDFEHLEELNNFTAKDALEYTDITQEYLEIRERKLKRIDKFIFLGTLLGRHIPRIAEKIDASMYLVLERNLEIFRLSLFTVDYTILAKKGAIFSIMDSPKEEENKIFRFLNISRTDNYFLKLSSTNINIGAYVDTVLSMLSSLNPTSYDYNRRLYMHVNRTTRRIEEKYKFLDFSKIKKDFSLFKNTSILYIAAGSSLDENIDWIRDNQKFFLIVCIGRVYKKLLENNIHVDIVTTLDEQELLKRTQFDDETVSRISKDTLVFASSITNKKILEKFEQSNLFLYEIFYPFYENNIAFDGFSVGEITLDILFKFKPKEIYMIGLDLSLNQKTGATHASEDRINIIKLNLDDIQDRSNFQMRKSLIKVPGNFSKEVYTTPFFYNSIKMTEQKLRYKDKTTKVYNLSNHGAKFEGSVSKKIGKIQLDKIKKLEFDNKELKEFLTKNSQISFTDERKEEIIKEIETIKNDLLSELEIASNKKFIIYRNFLEFMDQFIVKTSSKNLYILQPILYKYCELYIPYLSYYFNNRKLKSETKKLDKLKKVFIKQLRNILDDYMICLKRVVSK